MTHPVMIQLMMITHSLRITHPYDNTPYDNTYHMMIHTTVMTHPMMAHLPCDDTHHCDDTPYDDTPTM